MYPPTPHELAHTALEIKRIEKAEELDRELLTLSLRFIDKRYEKAFAALQIGRNVHTGMRKDGVTPEFMHQVMIAKRWLAHEQALKKAGIDVDVLMAIILLHDHPEDTEDLTEKQMKAHFKESIKVTFAMVSLETTDRIIDRIVDGTFSLSKKRGGITLDDDAYFRSVVKKLYPFLTKPGDIDHNTETLRYLNPEKQVENFLGAMAYLIHARSAKHPEVVNCPELADAVEGFFGSIEWRLSNHLNYIEAFRGDKGQKMVAAFKSIGHGQPLPRNLIAAAVDDHQFLAMLDNAERMAKTLLGLEPEKQVEGYLEAMEFLSYACDARIKHPEIIDAVNDSIDRIAEHLSNHMGFVEVLGGDKGPEIIKAFEPLMRARPLPGKINSTGAYPGPLEGCALG